MLLHHPAVGRDDLGVGDAGEHVGAGVVTGLAARRERRGGPSKVILHRPVHVEDLLVQLVQQKPLQRHVGGRIHGHERQDEQGSERQQQPPPQRHQALRGTRAT